MSNVKRMRIAAHRAGTYADRGTLQMPCTAGVPSRYGHRHRRCRRRHRGIAACVRADGRMELASWDSWERRVVGLQGEGGTGTAPLPLEPTTATPDSRVDSLS